MKSELDTLPRPSSLPAQPPVAEAEWSRLSQNEQAYRTIKWRIVTLRFRPGEHINEAGVAMVTGLGRTPVHQAFHRLMHEGLVQIMPRKGVLVRPLSMDEAAELIEVRRVNEPYCAALAAERIDREGLAALEQLVMDAYGMDDRDLGGLLMLDQRFHEIIAGAARNRVLADLLHGLHDRSLRFWAVSLMAGSHLGETRGEHRDLVGALRRHDPAEAHRLMELHIDSFRKTIAGRF